MMTPNGCTITIHGLDDPTPLFTLRVTCDRCGAVLVERRLDARQVSDETPEAIGARHGTLDRAAADAHRCTVL